MSPVLSKLVAAVSISRPINCLVAALSALPAVMLSGCGLSYPRWFGAAIYFVAAFGYIINDIFDHRIDEINRPQRVLPSRRLSYREALAAAFVCLVASLLCSSFVGGAALLYTLTVAAATALYAADFSRRLFVGNLWVAAICSSLFVAAPYVIDGFVIRWNFVLTGCILSFFYHLGREIVKDIEDVQGDQAHKRSSLPSAFGRTFAARSAAAVYGCMILLTYLPVLFARGATAYFLTVTVTVNLPIALLFTYYLRKNGERETRLVSRMLKLIMLPALIALVVLAGC